MERVGQPRRGTTSSLSSRLIGTVGLSALVTAALVMSSGVTSRLGVPQQWPWLLTGIQVLALWAAADIAQPGMNPSCPVRRA